MILVDTSVWIDYFNGVQSHKCEVLDQALINEDVLFGDIIICELLQGFRKEEEFNNALKLISGFRTVQLSNFEIAVKAARNFRFLREKGITIRKTLDMIIATWCIENAIPLLHNDKDFDRISDSLPLPIFNK